MPKSLVLGNGNILVGFDQVGQIRDFYFPFVGLEDQVGGFCGNKIGVFVDGFISWLENPQWQVSIDYRPETLASDVRAVNHDLALELEFLDVVYNERDIFLKQVTVRNRAERKRQVKIFFNQEFQFYESERANTAYYHPSLGVVIHYKGRRVVMVAGSVDGAGFDDYATGLMGVEGKQGTYLDAEDGVLSKNPIEYGTVDSTVGFTLLLEPAGEKTFFYWMVAAQEFHEAKKLHAYVLEHSPQHLIETTQNFWRAWVNKMNFTFYRLDQEVVTLFKKSLLIIRTHMDNRGGILASGDADVLQYGRDSYSYLWPRDGAFVAMAMDKAGYSDITKRFFEFCNEVLDEGGYLLHKYQVDKSLGSSWHPWLHEGQPQLPIQEDETATVLVALWHHYQITKDLEFIESIYNSFIKKTADFMMSYRDPITKLPKASYDLWEEKLGISTYTACSVASALEAAAGFSKLLGKEVNRTQYTEAAREMREAVLSRLYREPEKFFCKLINIRGDGALEYDQTIDMSSFAGVFQFRALAEEDPRLAAAAATAYDLLFVKTPISGAVRYLGDNYYRTASDAPSNPWIITTLWLVQYYIARAASEADLDIVKQWLRWVVDRAQPSGILSEQVHPFTGRQLSVAPLIWSHAAFVATIIQYLEKLEELGICKACVAVR